MGRLGIYHLKGLLMSKTKAPNSLQCTVHLWRTKRRFEAYGIIMATDKKMVSNKALALALGMDSRGLRQVLERDTHFLITLRGENHRTEPWYSINPDHSPLVLDEQKPPKARTTIVGGERLKLVKVE